MQVSLDRQNSTAVKLSGANETLNAIQFERVATDEPTRPVHQLASLN